MNQTKSTYLLMDGGMLLAVRDMTVAEFESAQRFAEEALDNCRWQIVKPLTRI